MRPVHERAAPAMHFTHPNKMRRDHGLGLVHQFAKIQRGVELPIVVQLLDLLRGWGMVEGER